MKQNSYSMYCSLVAMFLWVFARYSMLPPDLLWTMGTVLVTMVACLAPQGVSWKIFSGYEGNSKNTEVEQVLTERNP